MKSNNSVQIDIVVLGYNSNTCKSYLEFMYRNGYKVSKILDLRIIGNRRVVRLIIRLFGVSITWAILESYRKFRHRITKSERVFANLFSNIKWHKRTNYHLYSNSVETVFLNSINDPILFEKIKIETGKVFLFTGGGILSKEIFNIKDKRILHFHPGIVPDIRGADCLFWSILIKKRPGITGFYMNEGIDTGDVFITKEFLLPVIPRTLVESLKITDEDIYEYLLKYYDPILRAETLIELLENLKIKDNDINLSRLPSYNQDIIAGETYFFMHRIIREKVIEKILK
ncbi:MAG: hypothetical protein KDK36_19180 [Leptospiraceae bacterium]|nr:hypothetical protein [Leptospiraceae bacterium]